MKNLTYWLLITCGLYFVTGCSSIQEPEFQKIKHIRISEVTDSFLTLNAEAVFTNPNTLSGRLNSTHLEVSFGSTMVGTIDQNHSIEIPPDTTFIIPLRLVIDRSEVKAQKRFWIKSLGKMIQHELEVNYKGSIGLQIGRIKFKVPVVYTDYVGIVN